MQLLYSIPETWRKPVCLKRRDELIIIAQRAIDFIENYGEKITVKECQSCSFLSAIAIRDKFIESRRYVWTEPLSGSGDDSLYDELMLGVGDDSPLSILEFYLILLLALTRVYRYYAYETSWNRKMPVKNWAVHGELPENQ
ncbi:hypothetical protein FRC02_004055 [Tulasnella sp. 418]|nr:hypothetical protein FRC02_004055 [Tulasnella sp. 418]